MRVCPTCTVSTDESGRFCPACGSEMLASSDVETSPAESPASTLALLGARIDNQFEVEAVIGSGAFSVVYRARQLGIDRGVAIKVPTHEIASDPVMAKRFAREARSAARIRHPGVVAIYAVGELPDARPYLAMELVDGEPLDKILEGGVVAPVRALTIGRLIASALGDTHAAGVIHRDLKPSNIIWRRDRNGDDRITIVDFGIAVAKPGNADATRLTAGGLIGTPHYMSPEQAHGESVDGRSDLYALGCILYELVTGVTLFDGSGYEVMLAHLGKAPPRAGERTPGTPLGLDALIADLLAKRPEDRPASADDVVVRIDEALADLDGTSAATRAHLTRPKRPTAGTLADLPLAKRGPFQGSTVGMPSSPALTEAPAPAASVTEMPERRARWIAGLSIATVAVVVGGIVVAKLLSGGVATASKPHVERPPTVGEREYVRDDGETSLHMTLPDPLHTGGSMTARMQMWNKLGQPIHDVPVLTIEDPNGNPKGFNAHTAGPDEFEFTRRLQLPGTYKIRVFPANTDSELDVDVEVK